MEDFTIWAKLFAGFLKTDPIYSFILDAFPLMIISIFGAVVAQLNSDAEINKRSTMAGISSAIALAIMTNAVSREYQIKVHIQVLIALSAGLKGEQLLRIISDKVMERIKTYNGK